MARNADECREMVGACREANVKLGVGFCYPFAGGQQKAKQLLAEGADGVGVNCGRGFTDALKVVRKMAPLTDVPISVFPNAGLPEVQEGRLVYQQPPSYMAVMAEQMVALGVNMIGGCCGTDERHLSEIAQNVNAARRVQ